MKFACFSETIAPPMRVPFKPGLVDEATGRIAGRVAEHAPGRRQAQRLVRLAPVADLIEPLLDRGRVGRREAERRLQHELRVAVGRWMLEAGVAIGQPELRGRDDRLRAVAAQDPGRLQHGGDVVSCAPALAQTAPPTVPGMASPNSSPDRPACWVSVAARAIGTPAPAM